ncbi:MAG: adenylosuccinate lyase [candidate division WOR-3 bacterium]|uniref:Adenylosuccinate lyase n=1 Tax=candidate division WOR-3 bacterium TaxID=2052148 RepID=A0A7C2B8Z0_UNCW3|nr:adenylosuccinate lyase [candidate division WOR-3 bacterium]
MTSRYQTPEMAQLWSEETKFKTWLLVEKAVAKIEGELGIIPKPAAEKIQQATFKISEIERFEKETNHDVIAFTRSVAKSAGEAGKYVHYGITSYDVVDTALVLRCVQALDIIHTALLELQVTTANLARRYQWTPMIGRTHGVHAEPITFGLKCLSWLAEINRGIERVKLARAEIAYGKISGTVGAYTQLSPEVEKRVLKLLNLKVEPVSTQVIPRDRHAFLLSMLALIATGLERIATEIRNLQRTEIGEVSEPFGKSQAGSSAMPHKKNPIICERICSLTRVIRSYAFASYENIPLWHERDLTNSAAERIIIPEAFTLLHYCLRQMNRVLAGLVVRPEQMEKNLKISGETFFSQALLLALVNKGMNRTRAYRLVQKLSFEAISSGTTLSQLARNDRTVQRHLSPSELEAVFQLRNLVQHVDAVYRRVLGRK